MSVFVFLADFIFWFIEVSPQTFAQGPIAWHEPRKCWKNLRKHQAFIVGPILPLTRVFCSVQFHNSKQALLHADITEQNTADIIRDAEMCCLTFKSILFVLSVFS